MSGMGKEWGNEDLGPTGGPLSATYTYTYTAVSGGQGHAAFTCNFNIEDWNHNYEWYDFF